jgi:hypothetical protein
MKKKKSSDAPGLRPKGPTGKTTAKAGAVPGTKAREGPDEGLRPVHLLVLGIMGVSTAAALITHGTSLSNSVFIMLAVVAAGFAAMAVYRTLVPLASDTPIAEPEMFGGRTRAALEREKAIVLRAIKELEFDRAMGKVSDSDCEEMIGRLRARAVRLIRQLDSGAAGYRELIHRELDARLGQKGPAKAPVAGVANAAGGTQ